MEWYHFQTGKKHEKVNSTEEQGLKMYTHNDYVNHQYSSTSQDSIQNSLLDADSKNSNNR